MSLRTNSFDLSRHGHRFRSPSGAFGHAPVEAWAGSPFLLFLHGMRVGLKHINRFVDLNMKSVLFVGQHSMDFFPDHRLVINSDGVIRIYDRAGNLLFERAAQLNDSLRTVESARDVHVTAGGQIVVPIDEQRNAQDVIDDVPIQAGFRLFDQNLNLIRDYMTAEMEDATQAVPDGDVIYLGGKRSQFQADDYPHNLEKVTVGGTRIWSAAVGDVRDMAVHPAGGVVVVSQKLTDQWDGASEGEQANIWRISDGGVITHARHFDDFFPTRVAVADDGVIYVSTDRGFANLLALDVSLNLIQSASQVLAGTTSESDLFEIDFNRDQTEIYVVSRRFPPVVYRLDRNLNVLQGEDWLQQRQAVPDASETLAVSPGMIRGVPDG